MDKITYLGINVTKVCEFLGIDGYMRSHPVLGFWEHTLIMLLPMIIMGGLVYFLFNREKITKNQINLFCVLLQILLFLVTVIFILGGSWAAWVTGILFIIVFIFHRLYLLTPSKNS